MVMGAILLLAIFMATAMSRATVGLQVSSRDVAAKRATQTAKAGVRVAAFRANALGLDLSQILSPNATQCVVNVGVALNLVGLAGSNWCAPMTERLGTGAEFTYRVSAVVGGGALQNGTINRLLSRTVVSTGTVDGVTRRVYAELTAEARTSRSCLLLLCSTSGFLQSYRIKAGSFRQCSPVAPDPNNPASGC